MILLSCSKNQNIDAFIFSNDTDSIVIGYSKLESKNTKYINLIFEDPFNPSISYTWRHYGESIYHAKMRAMERISGLTPPQKITYMADTSIVEFYRKWAQGKGYLK